MRHAAFGWAEAALQEQLAEAQDDPLRRTDLSEVLAWSPAGRAPRAAAARRAAAASGMRELAWIAAGHCRQIARDPQARRPATAARLA